MIPHPAIAALLALALALAPERIVSDPEAAKLVAAAQEAFTAGDYAGASQMIEQAYLLDPVPQLLWPWAQAERSAGNCRVAIDLYQKFIDSGPSDDQVQAAQQNITRCEQEIGGSKPPEPPPPPPGPGGSEQDVVAPAPEVEPTVAIAKPDQTPVSARKWYQDPLGGALVGVGGGAMVIGIALAGAASSRAKKIADQVSSMSEYDDQRGKTVAMRNGGIAVLSIGAALLIGGIVRWALVAKKSKSRQQAALAPWIGPRGAGVGALVRF